MLLAAQTGLRASELIGLTLRRRPPRRRRAPQRLGKGRKQRITPLTKQTVTVLRAWTARARRPARPAAVPDAHRPRAQPRRARTPHRQVRRQPPPRPARRLPTKKVTPHVLRHTAAMRLLHAGVDTSVIALWLGHEQIETTQIYLHADSPSRSRRSRRTTPPDVEPGRYRPPDRSSPSSTRSDYADRTGRPPPRSGLAAPGRHNTRVGIVPIMPTSA